MNVHVDLSSDVSTQCVQAMGESDAPRARKTDHQFNEGVGPVSYANAIKTCWIHGPTCIKIEGPAQTSQKVNEEAWGREGSVHTFRYYLGSLRGGCRHLIFPPLRPVQYEHPNVPICHTPKSCVGRDPGDHCNPTANDSMTREIDGAADLKLEVPNS